MEKSGIINWCVNFPKSDKIRNTSQFEHVTYIPLFCFVTWHLTSLGFPLTMATPTTSRTSLAPWSCFGLQHSKIMQQPSVIWGCSMGRLGEGIGMWVGLGWVGYQEGWSGVVWQVAPTKWKVSSLVVDLDCIVYMLTLWETVGNPVDGGFETRNGILWRMTEHFRKVEVVKVRGSWSSRTAMDP